MSDFKIDARQLKRLDKSLTRAGKDYKVGAKMLLKEVGNAIQTLAMKYAPESPVLSDYREMNQDGETTRSNVSITSGSLRDSITVELGKDQVSVCIPSNSPAKKYAEKIHDKRGSEWHNLGYRSEKKGPKVGDKFIFRAADDSKKEIDGFIDRIIDRMTKDVGV